MLFEMVKVDLEASQIIVNIGNGKNKKAIVLNQPAMDQQTGAPIILNDVSAVKAKVVLDDIPSTPTFRMQQLQMLTNMIQSLPPNIQPLLVDYALEYTDMPQRYEAAQRVRDALGIGDQSPEQKAAMEQAQKHEADRQRGIEDKMIALTAAEKAAKIRETNAKADHLLTKG